MTRYPPEALNEDGWTDWIKPLPGYQLECCDCGSLHELEFRVQDGAVIYRAKPLPDAAIGDTHPKDGDALAAPLVSGDGAAQQQSPDLGSDTGEEPSEAMPRRAVNYLLTGLNIIADKLNEVPADQFARDYLADYEAAMRAAGEGTPDGPR